NAHDLVLWRLRATHELGTIEVFAVGRVDTLEQARQLADQCGAVRVAAVLDLQLAGGYYVCGRGPESIAAGQRAADAARRLHIGGIERAGTCFGVIGHALAGDLTELNRARLAAEGVAAGDPGWLASLTGDGLGMYALLNEDRRGAIQALERAAELGTSTAERLPSPWWGLWPLLRALRGADARQALAEAALVPVTGHNALMHGYTQAVLLGRDRQPAAAQNTFDLTDAAPTPDSWRHLGRRLAAEAALEDGWGDPVGWLTAAAEFFDGFPAKPVASACRSLLRRAGIPVTRRPAGVPDDLADLGVTPREVEVLALLGHGLSNRDIAARLYLSPRTVEKHVENLSRKIAARSRNELIAYAAGRRRSS
ncbi:MAG: LuxR family transcriptional regulator, partial [Pseudonocardia sp.]|nr:LuxR family transcriptional regulator [Pseudonocardia sp.]